MGAIHMLRKRLYAYAGIMAVMFVITGCDQKSDSEKFNQYVDQAQQEREAGNLDAAAIHLKNALQIRSEHAGARRALGELHFARGRAEAAAKEFRRALDYGAPAEEVETQLGRAYLATGRPEKVLDLIPSSADGAAGSLSPQRLTVRGLALEQLGRLDDAEAAFKAALDASEDAEAAVGLARVYMARNEGGPARAAIDQALAVDSDDSSALFLKSRLLLAEGETSTAHEILSGLVDRDPPMASAGILLIESHLRQGDTEPAWRVLDELNEVYPEAPVVKLFSSIQALSSGDVQTAKRISDELLGRQPDFQRAQLVSGIANLRLGNNELARSYLRSYVNARPADGAARLLLVQALLRLDDTESARELLADAEDQAASEMVRLLRQAGADLPERQREQTLQLAAAIEEGEGFSGSDPLANTSDVQPEGLAEETRDRFFQAVREQRYEDALEIAQRLKNERPESHLPYQMEGIVYLQQDKAGEAEKAFRQARDRTSTSVGLAILLSEALRRQDRTGEAIEVLGESIESAPESEALAVAKARLHAAIGEAEQVQNVLQEVIDRNPEAYRARLYLGRFYLLNGAPDKAVEVIEPAREIAPDEPSILEVLGRAQQAQGNHGQAAEVFKRLAEAAPQRAEAQRLAGDALIRAGQPAAAVSYLTAAAELSDEPKPSRLLLARALVLAGERGRAEEVISDLKQSYPEDAEIYLLSAQNKFRGPDDLQVALEDVERALELEPTTEHAVTRARMQVAAGERRQAISDLRSWLSGRPGMPGAKRALGELLLADDRYEDAAGVYADLLKAGQDDISVLNNLAWALTKAGRAEEAIEHAANAAAKAPSNPDVLDTYGVALRGGGQTNAAIEQFRLARVKAENRPDIALHLVEALLAAGKRAEARDVLGSINKSTLSDRERKKAENYRSQLDQ